MGFCCGAEMLCFAAALIHAKNKHNSGEVIGVINTFNMLGGGILEQIVGVLLDYSWSGDIDNAGGKIYCATDFNAALFTLLAIMLLCFILSLFMRHNR